MANSKNPARVLVVGDCMLDRYWHGRVARISPEAPVPVVHMNDQADRLGGAANVALNARRLGADVGLLGVLGDDDPGRSFLKLLREQEVADHVMVASGVPTVVKLRVVSQRQQLLRVDFEAPLDRVHSLELAGRFADVVGGCDCVVFSDYRKGALAEVKRMIDAARAAGRQIVVDPKGHDYEAYRGADVITPNQSELAQVAGAWSSENDLDRRAFELRAALGIGALLLTRSEHGMSLFGVERGEPRRTDFPAQAREVYDVTGAGDTAIATLAVMLSEGRPLLESVQLANRAAGLVVGKFGTASVSRAELLGDGHGGFVSAA